MMRDAMKPERTYLAEEVKKINQQIDEGFKALAGSQTIKEMTERMKKISTAMTKIRIDPQIIKNINKALEPYRK